MKLHRTRSGALVALAGVALYGLTLAPALGAVPKVTSVFVDKGTSPYTMNVVGVNFEAGTTVTLGSTGLVITARSATVLTVQMPALVAVGDYLLAVVNPGALRTTT